MLKGTKSKVYSWLRLSERLFKTDMVYLASSGFWLGSGQLVGSLVSFASAISFANLLPAQAYGEYRYVLSLLNVLAIPTLTGINWALMRSVTQKKDGAIFAALRTRLVWGIWGMVGSFGIGLYYLYQDNLNLAVDFLVMGIFVPLFYSFEIYSYFLRGKKLFRSATTYTMIIAIVSTTSLTITLFLTNNVAVLLVSYFLPYTALRGWFIYLAIKKYLNSNETDPEMLTYGKHLSVMGILSTVAAELDKVMLWHFVGPVQLAIYTFAEAPVNQVKSFTNQIESMIFLKVAERDISYLKRVVYGKMLKLLGVMALFAGGYMLLAPYFYKIFFPQYINAIPYSQVLALGLLALPITFISTTFTAHGKIKENYYIKFVSSIGNIVLLLILVPLYGVWGVILSYLAMRAIVAATMILLFERLKV